MLWMRGRDGCFADGCGEDAKHCPPPLARRGQRLGEVHCCLGSELVVIEAVRSKQGTLSQFVDSSQCLCDIAIIVDTVQNV